MQFKLDPRAFLNSYCSLWIVKSQSEVNPLLQGNFLLPSKLVDFVAENCKLHPMAGEMCYKFSIAFWEAPEKEYYSGREPDYRGKISVYTPDLYGELQTAYQRAFKTKNLYVDRVEYDERLTN